MGNQKTKWRMNLQLFAEDAPDGEGDEPQGNGGSGGAAQTYTAVSYTHLCVCRFIFIGFSLQFE